jgi:hypothetical protein
MYRVTQRRLTKAQPILDRHRAELHRTGATDVTAFEMALRACWKVGYQEMKDLATDLLKNDRYRFLAAYYMENSNGSRQRVAMEFKDDLAKLYQVQWYDAKDRERKRSEFWATMPRNEQTLEDC